MGDGLCGVCRSVNTLRSFNNPAGSGASKNNKNKDLPVREARVGRTNYGYTAWTY